MNSIKDTIKLELYVNNKYVNFPLTTPPHITPFSSDVAHVPLLTTTNPFSNNQIFFISSMLNSFAIKLLKITKK